jgi:hypothetical protein
MVIPNSVTNSAGMSDVLSVTIFTILDDHRLQLFACLYSTHPNCPKPKVRGQGQPGWLYHDLRIWRQALDHGCEFLGQSLGIGM